MFGLRHDSRRVLGKSGCTEKEDGKSRIESHRKIVSRLGKLELRRPPFDLAHDRLRLVERLV
jgi:hypothetical protein